MIVAARPGQLGFILTAIAAPAAAAGPPGWVALGIAAGIQGAMIGLQLLFSRKGPEQKIKATQIANEAEVHLRSNLDAYMKGPRTRADQQAALAVFDYAWEQFVRYCQDPALGDPGQRAVTERGPGGVVPGTNGNWFLWYRDPIANDQPTEATAGSLLQSATSSGGGAILLLAVALLAVGVLL